MNLFIKKLGRCLPVGLLMLPILVYGKGTKEKVDTLFTSDGVDVYVRQNKAFDLRVIAEAHVVDAEVAPIDPLRLSTGLNADYFFRRFVSLNARIKGTYYGLQQQYGRENNLSENKMLPFIVGDAGVRFHFLDRGGWVKRKVTLGRYEELNADGSPHTTVRYIRMPFPCRRVTAARGGYYYSNNPVSADMNGDLLEADKKGSVRTADGTILIGNYFTNNYNSGYYLGLSRITHMNIMVSSNIDTFEGGGKHVAFYREVYADIIVAGSHFDPFVVDGMSHALKPNDDGSFSVSKIGWRVGGRVMAARQSAAVGAHYEFGNRPGLYPRSYYVSAGITFAYIK
jgi:hypothetical protein